MTTADPTPRRLFRISDAMILTGVTAVGLAMARSSLRIAVSWPDVLVVLSCVLLPTWSITLIGLAFRRPRPAADLLLLRPGMVACISGIFNLSLTLCLFISGSRGELFLVFLLAFFLSGGGVIVAWSTLIVTGQWESDSGWIDRAGRGLGICWILASLTVVVLFVSALAAGSLRD